MKVNTDGVLLGAAVAIYPKDKTFLDIGTGTGLIALMIAQRRAFMEKEYLNALESKDYGNAPIESFIVEAIEIDPVSAEEAKQNFEASPWAENLKIIPLGLSDFENFLSEPDLYKQDLALCEYESAPSELVERQLKSEQLKKYDLIVSNPPYFENSVLTDNARSTTARHTTNLSYRELIEFAAKHLKEKGRLAMILPAEQEKDVLRYGRMNNLYLKSILRIRTAERKQPTRIIIELSRQRTSLPKQETSHNLPKDSILTIQKEGQYSAEYISLTKDFYLFA